MIQQNKLTRNPVSLLIFCIFCDNTDNLSCTLSERLFGYHLTLIWYFFELYTTSVIINFRLHHFGHHRLSDEDY